MLAGGGDAEILTELIRGRLPGDGGGILPHTLLKIPISCPGPLPIKYTGPPESPFWLATPPVMVNHPLLTLSTVPQVSPVLMPKWQTAWPGWATTPGRDVNCRPPGRTSLTLTPSTSAIAS
ncbi:hypothetical protein NIIDMKKI_35220 [Mycobacterium kansasii]|uniref:Uncharacterized protein n=1 Tax=Mycobacterium kansasii TaxID=1768 RepID=A0A7G1IB85_MYCKA|nr:hypothetical protein NIIDMKKI_35220 [Mycobacterium kansasii]